MGSHFTCTQLPSLQHIPLSKSKLPIYFFLALRLEVCVRSAEVAAPDEGRFSLGRTKGRWVRGGEHAVLASQHEAGFGLRGVRPVFV